MGCSVVKVTNSDCNGAEPLVLSLEAEDDVARPVDGLQLHLHVARLHQHVRDVREMQLETVPPAPPRPPEHLKLGLAAAERGAFLRLDWAPVSWTECGPAARCARDGHTHIAAGGRRARGRGGPGAPMRRPAPPGTGAPGRRKPLALDLAAARFKRKISPRSTLASPSFRSSGRLRRSGGSAAVGQRESCVRGAATRLRGLRAGVVQRRARSCSQVTHRRPRLPAVQGRGRAGGVASGSTPQCSAAPYEGREWEGRM